MKLKKGAKIEDCKIWRKLFILEMTHSATAPIRFELKIPNGAGTDAYFFIGPDIREAEAMSQVAPAKIVISEHREIEVRRDPFTGRWMAFRGDKSAPLSDASDLWEAA